MPSTISGKSMRRPFGLVSDARPMEIISAMTGGAVIMWRMALRSDCSSVRSKMHLVQKVRSSMND